jgi:hypothetical protein
VGAAVAHRGWARPNARSCWRSARSWSGSAGWWRWVERCCPTSWHAHRCGTPNPRCRCWTARRRRAGLTSFPVPAPSRPRSGVPCRPRSASAWRSRPRAPSADGRRRPSGRRTGRTLIPGGPTSGGQVRRPSCFRRLAGAIDGMGSGNVGLGRTIVPPRGIPVPGVALELSAWEL